MMPSSNNPTARRSHVPMAVLVEAVALIACAAVLWGVRWTLRRHLPAPVVIGTAGTGLTARPPRVP